MFPVYVVSLAGCEGRRAPLLSRLRDLGFEPEVVLGIDGRAGLPPEYEPRIDRPMAARHARRRLSDAEFACALSHQRVYSRLLEDGHERALVFEDDTLVGTDFSAALEDVAALEFDLVLLGHTGARARRGSVKHLPSGNALWKVMNIPDCSSCYVISAAGARKIIASSFPIMYTADWPCDISILRTYAMVPKPVRGPDDSETSLIHAGREASREVARWGSPSPPYSRTDLSARLDRLLARSIS